MSVPRPHADSGEVVLGRFQLDYAFRADPEEAASAIARAADIAVVVDPAGIVVDVAITSPELVRLGVVRWIGTSFYDVVTVESRPKLNSLLGAEHSGTRRWHQVNHPLDGNDLPVEYTVVAVVADHTRIIGGRELVSASALQQRLVAAQIEAEREYARVRSAEQRYRVLFRVASEAVVIADADSERVVEANPAAAELFDAKSSRLPSFPLASLFDPGDGAALAALVSAARATGSADEITARSAGGRTLRVAVSTFLQARKSYLLLRATPSEAAPARREAGGDVVSIIERLPDGFVVCNEEGRVMAANAAFVELTQHARVEQIRGEPLASWLGRTGVDADVLFASLRQHESIRSFASVLRGSLGTDEQVELAGVAVPAGKDEARFGLTVRVVRARAPAAAGGSLERSVEHMTELVGRVPLKDLVRETTDMIERLCIDAALRLSDNNRATAAEMLGLSRQSLYVKMRRFGQLKPGDDELLSS